MSDITLSRANSSRIHEFTQYEQEENTTENSAGIQQKPSTHETDTEFKNKTKGQRRKTQLKTKSRRSRLNAFPVSAVVAQSGTIRIPIKQKSKSIQYAMLERIIRDDPIHSNDSTDSNNMSRERGKNPTDDLVESKSVVQTSNLAGNINTNPKHKGSNATSENSQNPTSLTAKFNDFFRGAETSSHKNANASSTSISDATTPSASKSEKSSTSPRSTIESDESAKTSLSHSSDSNAEGITSKKGYNNSDPAEEGGETRRLGRQRNGNENSGSVKFSKTTSQFPHAKTKISFTRATIRVSSPGIQRSNDQLEESPPTNKPSRLNDPPKDTPLYYTGTQAVIFNRGFGVAGSPNQSLNEIDTRERIQAGKLRMTTVNEPPYDSNAIEDCCNENIMYNENMYNENLRNRRIAGPRCGPYARHTFSTCQKSVQTPFPAECKEIFDNCCKRDRNVGFCNSNTWIDSRNKCTSRYNYRSNNASQCNSQARFLKPPMRFGLGGCGRKPCPNVIPTYLPGESSRIKLPRCQRPSNYPFPRINHCGSNPISCRNSQVVNCNSPRPCCCPVSKPNDFPSSRPNDFPSSRPNDFPSSRDDDRRSKWPYDYARPLDNPNLRTNDPFNSRYSENFNRVSNAYPRLKTDDYPGPDNYISISRIPNDYTNLIYKDPNFSQNDNDIFEPRSTDNSNLRSNKNANPNFNDNNNPRLSDFANSKPNNNSNPQYNDYLNLRPEFDLRPRVNDFKDNLNPRLKEKPRPKSNDFLSQMPEDFPISDNYDYLNRKPDDLTIPRPNDLSSNNNRNNFTYRKSDDFPRRRHIDFPSPKSNDYLSPTSNDYPSPTPTDYSNSRRNSNEANFNFKSLRTITPIPDGFSKNVGSSMTPKPSTIKNNIKLVTDMQTSTGKTVDQSSSAQNVPSLKRRYNKLKKGDESKKINWKKSKGKLLKNKNSGALSKVIKSKKSVRSASCAQDGSNPKELISLAEQLKKALKQHKEKSNLETLVKMLAKKFKTTETQPQYPCCLENTYPGGANADENQNCSQLLETYTNLPSDYCPRCQTHPCCCKSTFLTVCPACTGVPCNCSLPDNDNNPYPHSTIPACCGPVQSVKKRKKDLTSRHVKLDVGGKPKASPARKPKSALKTSKMEKLVLMEMDANDNVMYVEKR